MALGVLGIIYVVLIAIAIIIQFLLYKDKNERKNNIYIVNMIFGVILAYMAFTSLPTNSVGQRTLALAFGVIAFSALALKVKTETNIMLNKIMLTVSIVGSFLLLYL